MKEQPIRLNDIVQPLEMKRKYMGHLHTLNNSLTRNKMYNTPPSNDRTANYECHLPQVKFALKDLTQILKCLLAKQEMQLADRNLIRRILVTRFDQELIHAGSRCFIQHLQVQEQLKQSCQLNPKQRLFYLVVKGEAAVSSGGFTYTAKAGTTFGQLQILSRSPIQFISYKTNTLLLTLSEIHFNHYFRQYFQRIYQHKFEQVTCIRQSIIDCVPLLNSYFFVDKIESIQLKRGDMITKQGETFDRIYLIGNGWKEQKPRTMVHGCLGLHQYFKQKSSYVQNVFCLQENLHLPFIPKDLFHLYLGRFLSNAQANGKFTVKSRIKDRANTEGSSPEAIRKSLNVMRIKRVKLIYPRSFKTDAEQQMVTEFKFLRVEDMDDKNIRLNSIKASQHRRASLMSEGKSLQFL